MGLGHVDGERLRVETTLPVRDQRSSKDGRVVDTLGTLRADVDGPASMIMPAHAQVGHAYGTENVRRLDFFEERS